LEEEMRLERKHVYSVGFLGTIAIVLSLLIFMYYTTLETESSILLSSVMLLVVGLLFAWIMVGVKFEPFELKRMFESILWTAMSALAIWVVNSRVPFKLDVGFMNTRLFSVLMGVAEESFFRLFLTTFMYKITKMSWLAIVVSSSTWTIYHIGRYGGDMGAFFVIFMAGLVLGFVMLYSKMADGVMFAHAVVNYLATS